VIVWMTRVLACVALGLAGVPVWAQEVAPPPSARSAEATPIPAEAHPTATSIRLAGDEKQTRVVLDFTRKIDMHAFTLADPYRLIIDLPQVNFQLPARTGEAGRGLVKAFRFGLMMKGGSRVVLDLTAPAKVEKSFVLDPVDDQPARLVLDLVGIDRDTFLRAIAFDKHAGPAQQAARKPDRDPAAPTDDPRPLIILDPGHGGIDEGAHARSGEAEKTVVLDFALLLRDKIERLGKYRVEMTRTEDTFVALADRVQFARARRAQLFLSIHCDALARGDGDAQGAAIYTLSDHASDAEAARLAEAENRADIIAGVDLSSESDEIADILIDLAQRETRTFSTHFARAVVGELKSSIRLHKQPLKSAGFRVLKAPDVPSALIELGFVSNRGDFKQLMSDAWRQRAGDAIVQAINAYFTTRTAGAPRAAGRR
jgi:N-acetylmuramoyl-L-alanine amidase